MKKFFNSYRIITLLAMIGFIVNGILHYYNLLTIKEYFVIFNLILFLSIIAYLINYISDSHKEKARLMGFNITLSQALNNSMSINNYLTNMCMKAYELVDNTEWRYAWSEFIKNMTKTKNNKKPLKDLQELKKDLKYFEEKENFEECKKILEKIKQLENNKNFI